MVQRGIVPPKEKGRYFMAKKKTLLMVPAILIMAFVMLIAAPVSASADDSGYVPRLTSPNSSIPYYSRQLNYYFQTGTGMPNCVAYVYGRVYEMNGEKPLITHGDASEWFFINKNGGYYEYGNQPKLGAVACWSNHVAVVERINSDGSVTFSESHWGGRYFNTVTYSNVYDHYGQKFYGYIYTYNEGVSRELQNKLLNAGSEKANQYKTEKAQAIDVSNQFTLAKMDITSRDELQNVKAAVPLLQNRLNS